MEIKQNAEIRDKEYVQSYHPQTQALCYDI